MKAVRLGASLLLALLLPGSSPGAPRYRDGEYFGMSRRPEFRTPLKILVRVDRGLIREIEFLSFPAAADPARLEAELTRRALQAQGPLIEELAFSRVTSEMFQEALGQALSHAGLAEAVRSREGEEEVLFRLETTAGPLEIAFFPGAGDSARNRLALARSGHYNNKNLYRLIPRTLVFLGEDPAEKTPEPSRGEVGGTSPEGESFDQVGLVGAAGPGGLLVINAIRAPWLDGQYPVIGRVVSGFRVIASLAFPEEEGAPESVRVLEMYPVSAGD